MSFPHQSGYRFVNVKPGGNPRKKRRIVLRLDEENHLINASMPPMCDMTPPMAFLLANMLVDMAEQLQTVEEGKE